MDFYVHAEASGSRTIQDSAVALTTMISSKVISELTHLMGYTLDLKFCMAQNIMDLKVNEIVICP